MDGGKAAEAIKSAASSAVESIKSLIVAEAPEPVDGKEDACFYAANATTLNDTK